MSKINTIKPNIDMIFYAAILILCYFCFNQFDILVIGGWSFTYLDGHIKDFYEVNTNIFGICNYFPSTSILFALWNLPIKLLGIVNHPTTDVGYVIFWYKLLPTLFFAGSAFFMYKIGRAIGLSHTKSKLLTMIWISSPILVFSMFIFGQTDIFTTFLMMVGLYYFMQKKFVLFALFLGISFTFKYFPFLIFVPLLLLVQKNPLKISWYLALSLIPICLEFVFYADSTSFLSNISGGPIGNLLSISFTIGKVRLGLFVLAWFIVCGICYYIRLPQERFAFYQTSFYLCLAVVCFLFILVSWHPQYLLFMTPFLAVTTFMNHRIKYFLFLDFLMMVAFIGFVVCSYPMNVDQNMMNLGILGKFNPGLIDPTKAFLMAKLFTLGINSIYIKYIYFAIFSVILILNVIFNFPYKSNTWEGDNNLAAVSEYWNYARLRFLGGVAVFVIPAFIAYFITLSGN